MKNSYNANYKKYKEKYMNAKNNKSIIYEIHVQEPWFSLIKSGDKKVEGRLNRGTFSKIKPSDTIIFFNMDKETKKKNTIKCKVIKITEYDTFENMLKTERIENVLPKNPIITINSVEDGVNVYRQWYSEKMEKQFGIIAIYLAI
jgi:ASC-1-like (ASCH) protein